VTGLAKTFFVVRIRRDGENLEPQTLIKAGFAEAHSQVVDQWLTPPYDVDALAHDDQERPWWLSATWLRGAERAAGETLLNQLITHGRPAAGPLAEDEDHTGFYAWMLATQPAGLTTAALGDPLWRIGCTHAGGAALIIRRAGRPRRVADRA
jgi:protein-L-isoaspartate(D-aspartate) O-methyltransferase